MELYNIELGENVKMLCSNEDSAVFQMRDASGEGTMTIYQVFAGVFLMFNDFHMAGCRSGFQTSMDMFCIDHCREGRIEWEVEKNKFVYIEAGDMQISTRADHCREFVFPLKHYHGITIGFCLEDAKDSILNVLDGFTVDLRKLKESFCPGDRSFFMRAGKQIERIFTELYDLPDDVRMPYFKIKILELLLFLKTQQSQVLSEERPYFYKAQVEKVKGIVALLTEDLSCRYALEELSMRFDFPQTSMKQCFKAVYGTTIYAYMKEYRMNAAALMLCQTGDSISEISTRLGYDNPSKFTAAFQSVIGCSPTEYRRSNPTKAK